MGSTAVTAVVRFSQTCSHTHASAEYNGDLSSFLLWYTQFAESPNMYESTLAMSGLSRGGGRKGGWAKRQRTPKEVPPPHNYTVRPGLQSSFPTSSGVVNAAKLVNIVGGAKTVHAFSRHSQRAMLVLQCQDQRQLLSQQLHLCSSVCPHHNPKQQI